MEGGLKGYCIESEFDPIELEGIGKVVGIYELIIGDLLAYIMLILFVICGD